MFLIKDDEWAVGMEGFPVDLWLDAEFRLLAPTETTRPAAEFEGDTVWMSMNFLTLKHYKPLFVDAFFKYGALITRSSNKITSEGLPIFTSQVVPPGDGYIVNPRPEKKSPAPSIGIQSSPDRFSSWLQNLRRPRSHE